MLRCRLPVMLKAWTTSTTAVCTPGRTGRAWAGLGFAGNELFAGYRIRTGRRIGSGALVADGLHAHHVPV
jgi:divalent metal cation (Fe/Co/Zn/Cd) transporter